MMCIKWGAGVQGASIRVASALTAIPGRRSAAHRVVRQRLLSAMFPR